MDNGADAEQGSSVAGLWLGGCALASVLVYAALSQLSQKFTEDFSNAQKPTLWMLALFAVLFVLYFVSMRLAVRLQPSKQLIAGIFAAACLFRGVLLPSVPMHEIDIYRYIWDGAVFAEGVSPYRYSPQQLHEAVNAGGVDHDETLQSLVELQAKSQSLSDSLFQIHYGEFPSPYPIVSQAVFAVSAKLTPDSSSRQSRLVIMKAMLVLFDLGTLVVVIALLRDVGMHPGLSLAYGWCPLVLKEVANGGHLDSIAVFLTTLAVWLLVRSQQVSTPKKRRTVGVGAVLALAIGAKLYPVVLMPLFAALWFRRRGWAEMMVGLASTAVVSAVLLYPLFGVSNSSVPTPIAEQTDAQLTAEGQLNSPELSPQSTVEADEGIQAFLSHWEMNDLIFMIVLENLRQQEEIAPERRPWFVVTSDAWSRGVVSWWVDLKQELGLVDDAELLSEPYEAADLRKASFSLARVITGGAFGLIACLLAWFAAGKDDPQAWCRATMLTLAWFWLTCPTQNPWYWCWVLPFLPFARYRAWYAVGAVCMLYYLRFWLSGHYPEPPALGTPYSGAHFFYFIVAWFEFVPIYIALASEWLWQKKYRES